MTTRTGIGWDSHRLTAGRPLVLGGVALEHPDGLGLDGHSDADVLTHAVIDALLGAGGNGAGFLLETNEALIKMGVLGTYRGAKIITLKNYLDDTSRPFFPGNEMFVVGKDSAKFAFWGGMLSKEYTEDNAWYWHFLARRDFGGMVHRRSRVRRLVDVATAP